MGAGGVAGVALPAVMGPGAGQRRHPPVAADLGDDRRRGDRQAATVAADDRAHVARQVRGAVAVHQRVVRPARQPGDGAAHRRHRRPQDVVAVDLLHRRLADRDLGDRAQRLAERRAAGGVQTFGIVDPLRYPRRVEDRRSGEHRAGERPAARLVHAANDAVQSGFEREIGHRRHSAARRDGVKTARPPAGAACIPVTASVVFMRRYGRFRPVMRGLSGFAARSSVWAPAIAALAAAGCAGELPAPAPVDLAGNAERLLARDLSDEGLRDFLAALGLHGQGTGSQGSWTLDGLTAAAIRFDAGIAEARARWRRAVAAETTAARRAAPALAPELAWDTQPDGAEDSPLTVGFALALPLAPGDRRAARLALARAETDALAFETMRLGWERRAVVRRAAIDCRAAELRLADAGIRRGALERIVALHERRHALGEAGAGAVARARRDADEAAREEAVLAGDRETCRGRLAAALGAPLAAVASLRLDTSDLEDAAARAAPAADARRAALTGRLDIRAALARHAAAEARLALEVTRRRPGIALEPGLFWDRGGLVWSLGSQIGLGFLFDNAGPVREAAAARETAARAVLAKQAGVLAELAAADAALAAARLRRESARSAAQRAGALLGVAEARRAGGEAGRLAVLEAELGVAAAASAETEARLAVMAAVAAYEDVLERPAAGAPDFDLARLALLADTTSR